MQSDPGGLLGRATPVGWGKTGAMPKTKKSGEPIADELPATLQRSDDKAQRTYAKTHDSALDTYDGDERRANQAAFAALKHTHEKVGDHWEPKDEYGPSDDRAAGRSAPTRRRPVGWTPTPARSTSTSWPPSWRSRAVRR